MESPTYDISGPACVNFYYRISTPKITLTVQAATRIISDFSTVAIFTFANQATWNIASVRLDDGVLKLRFFAEKTSITSGSEFVSVDNIELYEGHCEKPTKGRNGRTG